MPIAVAVRGYEAPPHTRSTSTDAAPDGLGGGGGQREPDPGEPRETSLTPPLGNVSL